MKKLEKILREIMDLTDNYVGLPEREERKILDNAITAIYNLVPKKFKEHKTYEVDIEAGFNEAIDQTHKNFNEEVK